MNKRAFGLKDVSSARNFIYGFAIIWIIFYHSALLPASKFFSNIKYYGDCGVEIFFLLSGICLYFSYGKKPEALPFFKRRAARVFPPYLIIYGIVFIYLDIISSFNIGQFLLDYTMLDFWLHGLGRAPWFLAGIIVFYCIYPLVFKIFFGGQKYKALYIVIFCTALAAIIVALVKFYPHLNIFTVRIPVFIIGSLFGKLVFEDYGVKIWQIILISVLTFLSYFLFKSYPLQLGTRNLFYIFLSFSLIMALSEIYKLFAKFIPVLNVPFEFTGKISLEIYLCHEKIQEFLFRILNAFGLNVEFNQKWYQWLCFALAILLSFLINRLCSLLTRPKKDRQKTENAAQ